MAENNFNARKTKYDSVDINLSSFSTGYREDKAKHSHNVSGGNIQAVTHRDSANTFQSQSHSNFVNYSCAPLVPHSGFPPPPNLCPPLRDMFPPQLNVCPPPQNVYPPTFNAFPLLSACPPETSPLPFLPTFQPPPFPSFSTSDNLAPVISSSFSTTSPSPFPPFASVPHQGNNRDEGNFPGRWLDQWISRGHSTSSKKKITQNKISISDYKKKMVLATTLIKELDKMLQHLHIMNKSLDDEEWFLRKEKIGNQQRLVQNALTDLKNIPPPQVAALLKKRKCKRLRLKRKRDELKEIKLEKKVICELEHSRIDLWLEKMKEQVQHTRREEEMKRQADTVLSEVTQRKIEAKRMLGLLTTLGKLRNARIHDRQSKGEFVSNEAATAFNSIIEKLKKYWVNQINGYNLEEHGLRVMLSDAEVQRSNTEKSLAKQILQQWLNAMFGIQQKLNSFQIHTVDDLIHTRKCWDQFVVKEDSVGSSMPVGWILPSPPSSNVWATLLTT